MMSIEQRPSIGDKKYVSETLESNTVIGKNHQGALLTINYRSDQVSLD